MASTDKAFAYASAWSTAAVLVGVAVLPLLPPTGPEGAFVSKVTRVAKITTRAEPDTSSAEDSARHRRHPPPPARHPHLQQRQPPVAPPAPAPRPSSKPGRTPSRRRRLRECLQLLAPLAVEIAVEDPVKHGQCGTPAPVPVRSIGTTDKVELSPAPTMNCRLAAELAGWVEKVLQPTAREVLGTRVTRIVGASSYSCRNIYNMAEGPLSEHATGAAIDIAGFVTADGRSIRVAKAWGPTERDIAEARRKEIAAQLRRQEGERRASAAKAKDEAAAADKPTPSIEDAAKKSRAAKADQGRDERRAHRSTDARRRQAGPRRTARRDRRRRHHAPRLRSSSGCTRAPAPASEPCSDPRPTRRTAITFTWT